MSEKNCDICGVLFVKTKKNQRYCSRLCYKRSWNYLHRETHNERQRLYMRHHRAEARKEPVECPGCQTLFVRKSRRMLYCSDECQHKFYARWTPSRTIWRKRYYDKTRQKLPWRSTFDSIKGRAKKKGLAFDLTHEWALVKYTGFCELTDKPFVVTVGRHPYSPSFDRIDPSKGYLQSNCRLVLWCVNSFKTDGTDEQMYEAAEALIAKRNLTRCLQNVGAVLSLPG